MKNIMLYFLHGQSEVTYGHVVLLQSSYSKNQGLLKTYGHVVLLQSSYSKNQGLFKDF